ncbi:mitochondrial uncoupling protein 4 [Glossina fuscipes]|uniref:Mitochondrial uncoupling protein 4 n=1 Tax=Glossina fuscipes TaxID=7396 RepID=A0A9C5Z439_9MUSC|nr:mitochondrial uncoupling protein 4 [Glossina fuscipes]
MVEKKPIVTDTKTPLTENVEKRFIDTIPCTYILSVLAATNAELITYPLDLTKTRLQIQGELAKAQEVKAKYRGMLATAFGIVKEEGPLKLWYGVSSVIYRHMIYSGVRVCTYDYLRTTFGHDNLPVWKSALFGLLSGCLAQWLANPADLVKVQMQMEGKRRLMGEPPRILSSHQAFVDIYKRGGIVGLWQGSVPSVQRAALVNLGDLTAYDLAKRFLIHKMEMKEGPLAHMLASFVAGFVAAVAATPADVVKSRVMNQPTDERGRGIIYKGSLDCLKQTVSAEGYMGLYKGFVPHWIRLGPWALTFWVTFEQLRSILGGAAF